LDIIIGYIFIKLLNVNISYNPIKLLDVTIGHIC